MFGVDELGMDLGTSTLHIVVKGKGVVTVSNRDQG